MSARPVSDEPNQPAPFQPLRGIPIIDFTRFFVGPCATMMLVRLGVDVIRIKMPVTGYDTRAWDYGFCAATAPIFTPPIGTSAASPSARPEMAPETRAGVDRRCRLCREQSTGRRDDRHRHGHVDNQWCARRVTGAQLQRRNPVNRGVVVRHRALLAENGVLERAGGRPAPHPWGWRAPLDRSVSSLGRRRPRRSRSDERPEVRPTRHILRHGR